MFWTSYDVSVRLTTVGRVGFAIGCGQVAPGRRACCWAAPSGHVGARGAMVKPDDVVSLVARAEGMG